MDKEMMMMNLNLVISIVCFLVGRYLLPKYKKTIKETAEELNVIFKQAECLVSWARQFLDADGPGKMDAVVEKLGEFCDAKNIDIDQDTLKAYGQKAYDSMLAGEKSAINTIKNIEECDK